MFPPCPTGFTCWATRSSLTTAVSPMCENRSWLQVSNLPVVQGDDQIDLLRLQLGQYCAHWGEVLYVGRSKTPYCGHGVAGPAPRAAVPNEIPLAS